MEWSTGLRTRKQVCCHGESERGGVGRREREGERERERERERKFSKSTLSSVKCCWLCRKGICFETAKARERERRVSHHISERD